MAAIEDQTTLTQFATPTSESKSSQSLFARLLGRDKGADQPDGPAISYTPNKVSIRITEHQSTFYAEEEKHDEPDTSTMPSRKKSVGNELRTFSNVVGRLMNIMEKKSSSHEQHLKPYKDSEFRQSWMPDSSCKECYDCGCKFTTFLRRHHCRICGQIFCSSCCNQEVPGRAMGFEGGLRACTYCCGVISDLMEGSDDDIGTLRDNLKAQLTDSNMSTADLRGNVPVGSHTPSRRLSRSDSFEISNRIASVFDIAPTPEPMLDMTMEERQTLVKDSLQLKALFFEMLDPVEGVQLTSKRHRLKTYPDCFHGYELVNWLIENDNAQDGHQAVIIGQALLDAKHVLCLTYSSTLTFYNDYTLYQFRELTHSEQRSRQQSVKYMSPFPDVLEDVPSWIQELEQSEPTTEFSTDFGQSLMASTTSSTTATSRAKSGGLDSNFDIDSKTLSVLSNSSRARHGSNEQLTTREEIYGGVTAALCEPEPGEQLTTGDEQTLIHNQFKSLYKEHILQLCMQLLEKSRVSLSWTDIIMELSAKISHFVRPDVCLNKDLMNIASYVHIKKVRSGDPMESTIVYGTICTKSVIHNRMKTSVRTPTIMLVQSSIEYQRVTNKLSSLDPQILQEKEYLQNCVAKICKYKPDVLLVENTVSRVAQQLLLEAGITVIINVKATVMHRVARMTMAEIVPSIDSLISSPKLGTCYKFKTDSYRFHDGYYKTLMLFSGCPSNLGCTVLLRGENYEDLIKVKSIIQLIVNACYQAKLEISYMDDQAAKPPADRYHKGRTRHGSSESKESVDLLPVRSPGYGKLTDSPQLSPNPASSSINHFQELLDASPDSLTFRQILSNVILDYSPFITIHPPYFETDKWRVFSQRQPCAVPSFWSPLLAGAAEPASEVRCRGINEMYDNRMNADKLESLAAELTGPHQFVTWGVDCSASDKRFKNISSAFRASGGRLAVKSGAFSGQNGGDNSNERLHTRKLPIDCFDIGLHQRMSVLFSSYTTDMGIHPCVKPWIVPMEFYGRNDIPLGQFLDLYCFQAAYRCPRDDCEISMLEHIRKFVHGTGSLYLIVRKITQPVTDNALPTDSKTTTWSWCRKCKKATPVVPLSPSTWHLSFARYLQLQLNTTLTGSHVMDDCVHSVFKDYYQYFRYEDLVATFKFSAITLREVQFPAAQLAVRHNISKADVAGQVRIIHTHGLGLFSEVMEIFHKLEARGLDNEGKKQVLIEHKEDLAKEKAWFTTETDRIQTKLLEERLPMGSELSDFRSDSTPEFATLYQLDDDIIKLKCHLSRSVQQWNIRLDALNAKDEKKTKNSDANASSKPIKVADTREDSPTASSVFSTNDYESIHTTASGMDPEGPILSATYEFDKIHGRSSSFDSTNDTAPLASSIEYDLAHYHHSISGGLRAGVRNDTLTSEGSVGSFVLCGTSDMTNPIPTKPAPTHDPHRTRSQPSEITANTNTLRIQSDVFNPSPMSGTSCKSSISDVTNDNPQQEVATEQDAKVPPTLGVVFDLAASPALSDGSPQQRRSTPLLSASSHDPSMQLDTSSEAPLSPDSADRVVSGGNSEVAVSPAMDSFLPPADVERYESQEAKVDTSDAEDLTLTNVVARVKPNRANQNRYVTVNDATDNQPKPELKRVKLMKKSGSRYFIDTVKTAILSATDESITIFPVENLFSENEHFLLWPTVSVPIIVYDEEPSSIIAYALGSQAYADNLTEYEKQMMMRKAPVLQSSQSLPEKADPKRDNIEAILQLTAIASLTSKSSPSTSSADGWEVIDRPDSRNSHSARSDPDLDDIDQYRFGKPKDRLELSISMTSPHVELEFTEKSVGGDKLALFYCKVYFAVEFVNLRKLAYPEGEKQFIRSLSRCYKWNVKGGKSGLGFSKTNDDRFIMKQMGRQEVQSFMDFGPYYFQYLTELLQPQNQATGKKCALAKILGVYRIGLKNFVTNAVFKQDVLIIENLFYGHRVSKVFDLKGSARNRLVKKETLLDSVLLDENFMRYSKQSPIYVREHSKRALMTALLCDSQFLARYTVMDYSLLCGYDEDTKELVVGVIDYIRTFTWDKKLETMVKGFGGQGKMPTIVSPEMYRSRFLEAMDRYFNVVPDRWTGFTSNVG